MTSRKPAVVTKAVRAPLRWISALVASVVPWMIVAISAMPMPACHHLLKDGEDGALRSGVVGQDLGGEEPARDLQRHVGEGAADVDAGACRPFA